MLEEEAIEYLEQRVKEGGNLVEAVQGTVPALKQLHEKCLDADIPTMLGPCAPGGWTTKGTLLVEEQDIPRVAQLMRSDWEQALAREGLAPVQPQPKPEEDEAPCPACGTAAPLVDGACSDCGLTLG